MAPLQRVQAESLEAAAAQWLAQRLAAATCAGAAVFATCGGRSAAGILRRLAATAGVRWAQVHVFLADERVVPPDDAQSNCRLLRENLLDVLPAGVRLPAANIHPFRFGEGSPARAAAECADELARLGGRFDAVLLSAGEDGHVASLFPHHPSVRSDAPSFLVVEQAPKPPPGRVSASRALLQRSGGTLLLFAGEGKREALMRYLDPQTGIDDCPAALVRPLAGALVLTDLEAR